MFAAFGLRGVVDLVLASVTALPAALAALAFYGMGTSTGNVTFSSVIQSHVPEQLRGRMFSAFDLIWQAMRLASLLLGGLLADAYGIRAVFYVGGVLLLAAALAGLTTSAVSRSGGSGTPGGVAAAVHRPQGPPLRGGLLKPSTWPVSSTVVFFVTPSSVAAIRRQPSSPNSRPT